MNKKIALLLGSTGLVGSHLLDLLLQSDDYHLVRIFVRKKLNMINPKLEQIVVDYDHLDQSANFLKGDDLFICLGTTMAKAGSKEAFFKVDHTYCFETAKLAVKNGTKQLVLVSSMGADVNSMVYYSKVKGMIENDISALGFEAVRIVRPSLLLGERKEKRMGEKIFTFLSKALGIIFVGPLKKYKPIQAANVAGAMINLAQDPDKGVHIYESPELQKVAHN